MEKKKQINPLLVTLIISAVVIMGAIGYVIKLMMEDNPTTSKSSVQNSKVAAEYRINSNGLEKFDLAFLKLENKNENVIYSPLSIKYALQMLGEGANNNTKTQIDSIIGNYKYKKYNNNKNMSFANAMFIKDNFKNQIVNDYTSNLKNRYNAEVITDSFSSAKTINNWVKDKTFNLIDDLVSDEEVEPLDFALVNALAIDMYWTNLIQEAVNRNDNIDGIFYYFHYVHENYGEFIAPIEEDNYPTTDFAGGIKAKSVEIGASINKYDIVNTLGRSTIKKQIADEYADWMQTDSGCVGETDPNKFADKFIEELDKNYKQIDKSTDFYFNDTNDVKVFAKDLKEYDGTQLQYVGIMPKDIELKEYVNKIDAKQIQGLIDNLKGIELSNFDEGVVTRIKGTIPLFSFEYELNLKEDLKQLGITDIFEQGKADLSNMIKSKDEFIDKVAHKANIEFSNEGIKAAATTMGGGLGDASCGFEHLYEVPIKDIDLTFDKPYLFLIRDKKSGEIWFVGTVYEPTVNTNSNKN